MVQSTKQCKHSPSCHCSISSELDYDKFGHLLLLIKKCILLISISENEVDEDSFKLLDNELIKELFPKVGPRSKFTRKYQEYMSNLNGTGNADIPEDAQPRVVPQDAQARAPENAQVQEEVHVDNQTLSCFKCQKKIRNCYLFIHLQYVHNINSGTCTRIVCPECQIVFTHCKSYKKHVRKYHVNVRPQHIIAENHFANNNGVVGCEEDIPEEDVLEVASDDESGYERLSDSEDEFTCTTAWDVFTEKMALFVCDLNYKCIPTSSMQNITDNVESVIHESVRHGVKEIQGLHEKWRSGSLNGESFTEAINSLESLEDPLREMKSEKRQLEYFKQKEVLIPPVSKTLGYKHVPRVNKVTGRAEEVKTKETLQYIPIGQMLKKYLEQPGMMRIVLKEINGDNTTGMLRSYQDGEYYRTSFKEDGKLLIPLLLYSDDLEISNPLGSRKGAHKVCAFYMSILCLPQKFQSALSNILLVALTKSKLLSKYGIDKVLDVICDELEALHADGIKVDTPEYKGQVYPKLFQVIGDNLAVHSLLGFPCGFTANHFCRECKLSKYDCQEDLEERADQLRTRQNFVEDLETGDLTTTGVARNSSLNKLSYYHVIDNHSFDLMHDLYEGVVPLVVKLVVKDLIDQGAITLGELNSRLTSFSYGFVDKQNRPSPLTLASLMSPKGASGQSASQMNCLLHYLCLMIGDKVPRESETWEVLCSLLDITKLLTAPGMSVEATYMLKAKVAHHLQLYIDIFNMPLTPKQHFLVHYAHSIRPLGPLNTYSSIRYEGKHKELKRIAKNSNNFINVAKTIAKRNQSRQCLGFLLKQDVDQREIQVLSQDVTQVSDLEHADKICTALHCPLYSDVTVASAVQMNGYILRPHSSVLLSWNEDLPKFGEIGQIIIVDGTIYFAIHPWTTLYFDRHFHAYAVQVISDTIELVQYHELNHHRPVHAVKSYDEDDQMYYIVLRFQLA